MNPMLPWPTESCTRVGSKSGSGTAKPKYRKAKGATRGFAHQGGVSAVEAVEAPMRWWLLWVPKLDKRQP
jgi:hypothetical protein